MGAGRFPELPPSLPRRGNAVTRSVARGLLTLFGWRVDGTLPDRPKLVAIVAPHTSNWDFVLGIAVVYALGLRVRFLGKHTLFRPPLGWLMRWLGGTPVVRETPQGAVADAADMIAREEKVLLGIAPQGTRRSSAGWRSGFYNIALAARVPILPVAFDGERKAVRLFAPLAPGGDYEADLPRLQALYEGVRGLKG
ncbi:MAG TPA: lysophospholipid acyltransferase family protein [Burkholderiales bacterium]|nr:lysophospholipid acyltransferase family protein [Burkholderiales bacterium]